MGHAVFFDGWHAHPDVSEFEVEVVGRVIGALGSCIAGDQAVGTNDFFDFAIDEVVEAVNVLLDEASQPEKGGH